MKHKKPHPYHHIVITGASSGIGAALAMHFAAPGICLSLCGRNKQRLQSVAQACRNAGAEAQEKTIDVTDAPAMREWLESCDAMQHVDLIIANAGISGGTGAEKPGAEKPGAEKQCESPKQIEDIFAVNFQGVLNTIHPLLPQMSKRNHGQIAIMSSLAGFYGWPGAPAYCASKAAVKSYGESLRGLLAKNGVKINVICPGFVKSRMSAANDFPMPFII